MVAHKDRLASRQSASVKGNAASYQPTSSIADCDHKTVYQKEKYGVHLWGRSSNLGQPFELGVEVLQVGGNFPCVVGACMGSGNC